MPSGSLFQSFFLAGFECASQKRRDGRRLDLVVATHHDRLAEEDYRQALAHGLKTARDGLRWHRIERLPGRYDWSSFLPTLHAAHRTGVQVVWDLCHYGYPDGVDIWGAAFVDRFARFAAAAARLVREETGAPPMLAPLNEISYWAWAGGDKGRFAPSARRRGDELKRQLARAAIAAAEAIRAVEPEARIVHTDPVIRVTGKTRRPHEVEAARAHHEARYQAWDMIAGRLAPELGGRPEHLDVLGLNFYPDNQWFHGGATIPFGHHLYWPFRRMLAEVHGRYGRPLFVAETGAEGSSRAAWLTYVAGEVRAARQVGVPVEGICLYPLLDYPGWEDERHCEVGLFGLPGPDGARPVHAELAQELRRQQRLLDQPPRGAAQQAALLHLVERTG